MPVAGSVVQAAVVERVCRVLSSLVIAGVDLPRAMAVAAESSNNAVYSKGINHIREQMMEGNGLAEPLTETGLFPAAAQQMFRVGEETGTLDKQLETAASYYHRELELKVKHFTSLFEPAVIIFMGLIVGFVAVALVSAMYGIYNQVNVAEVHLPNLALARATFRPWAYSDPCSMDNEEASYTDIDIRCSSAMPLLRDQHSITTLLGI